MRMQGRRQKAEGRGAGVRCCARSFLLRPSSLRFGVTLVELLITITIIAILSATFLGVSRLAMEGAREARTKTTIGKIHSLLMEKWAEYPTRRVDFNRSAIESAFTEQMRGLAMADVRLLATRELMKLEMPDRWSDILGDSVGTPITQLPGTRVLSSFPSLRNIYLRRYLNLKKDPSIPAEAADIVANQGAECLYMIIMLATGDGEARSTFSEQDIGDTDDDGAPEFLDGWGRPIEYLRWPAGFWERSDLIAGPELADQDHDPFDMFRRDEINVVAPPPNYPSDGNPSIRSLVNQFRDRSNSSTAYEYPDGRVGHVSAFRLVPLLYSSGPDGVTDIDATYSDLISTYDPYAIDSTNKAFGVGLPRDLHNDGDNSLDNIHNHLQDNR